jgi:fumarate reductase subunit C
MSEGAQRERGATTVVRPEGRGPDHQEERAQSERVEYGGFYARWYRPRVSRLWWLRRRSYLRFVLRELSSVFVAWFVVFLLLLVRAVAAGEHEYQRFLDLSANPWMLALNVIALFFVVFHTITWFALAPQAMAVRLGGRRVPGTWILVLHYLAWAAVSAVMAWVILG